MKINGLRFIVGNGCNYNCFYCHHEGFFKKENKKIDSRKLDKIFNFAEKNNIKNISITGGEPFAYWDNVLPILKKFNDSKYRITLNSNLSLVSKYIKDIDKLNEIEFHINLSSLSASTHEKIINGKYLEVVKQNIEKLKQTKHKICLNIPVLRNHNLEEIIDLYLYAKDNGLIPRFLVLMPVSNNLKSDVVSIEEIIEIFGGGRIIKKYSYGLYKAETKYGTIDIVKCLCDDLECELCKETTFMHLTPDLNIKYCMKEEETVEVDYTNENSIRKSFEEAYKKLEMINR